MLICAQRYFPCQNQKKVNSLSMGISFKYGHCGWKGDSDLNGAKMIQILGQSVSLPVTPNPLFCSLLNGVRD